MEVEKINSKELTINLVLRLSQLYHANLGEFVVITDKEANILYVNQNVPERDIAGFKEVIMFPGYAVADEDTPTGRFLDYVYQKYGCSTYFILLDAHKYHVKQKEKEQAEQTARAIIPLIEKAVNSETLAVGYDERLMYEIWKAGSEAGRQTPENLTNYGNVYEFYYGYLLGAELLKGGETA